MILKKTAVVCAAALFVTMFAAGANAEVVAIELAARQQAFDILLDRVKTLELSEGVAVGQMLDEIEDDLTWYELLKDVAERRPVRHYGNGDTEVELRISVESLKSNLAELFEEYLPESEINVEELEYRGDFISATGIERRIGPNESPVAGPPSGLAGWNNVSARQRAALERATLDDARAKVADWLEGELADAVEAEDAAEAAEKIAALLNPESKAYLTGGVLEIYIIANLDRIDYVLTRDDSPFSLDEGDKIFDALKERDAMLFEARAYRAIDGRELDVDELDRFVTLEEDEFPGRIEADAPVPHQEMGDFQVPFEF